MPSATSAKKIAYISLRTSRAIKEEIAQAAASKGRSLSGSLHFLALPDAEVAIERLSAWRSVFARAA